MKGSAHPPGLDILSQQQLRVLRKAKEGLHNHQIAEQLQIPISTVEKMLSNEASPRSIYRRIGVRGRIQALNWLARQEDRQGMTDGRLEESDIPADIPTDGEAALVKAKQYNEMGQLSVVELCLRNAVNDFHQKRNREKELEAMIELSAAISNIGRQSDYERALQIASDARKLATSDSTIAELNLKTGITQRRLGRSEEAIADLSRALDYWKWVDNALGIAETHIALGDVQLQAEDFDAALQHFNAANRTVLADTKIQKDPEAQRLLAQTLHAMGRAQLGLGELEAAYKLFVQGRDQHGRVDSIWGVEICAHGLATLEMAREDPLQAHQWLLECLELNPLTGAAGRMIEHQLLLARLNVNLGKRSRANKHADVAAGKLRKNRFVVMAPQRSQLDLGKVYLSLNEETKACAAYAIAGELALSAHNETEVRRALKRMFDDLQNAVANLIKGQNRAAAEQVVKSLRDWWATSMLGSPKARRVRLSDGTMRIVAERLNRLAHLTSDSPADI